MTFKPKIIGFLCTWCSYAGADLAGVSRIQYPPNIRVVRLLCSGRVEPSFVFEALKHGIDGVIIMGCHPGECHYLEGNLEAEMKYQLIKDLLSFVKLSNRVTLEWVSASEGIRFGKVVTDFTQFITELGPSPFNNDLTDPILLLNLNAIQNAAESYRLRAIVGRKRKILNEGNVYDRKYPKDNFARFEKEAIIEEYERNKLLLYLEQEESSVKGLAIKLNVEPSKVLEYIVDLRSIGLIEVSSIQHLTPYYNLKH